MLPCLRLSIVVLLLFYLAISKMSLDEETTMILLDMALYCTITVVSVSETMNERTLRKTVGQSPARRLRSAHNSENHVDFAAHHPSSCSRHPLRRHRPRANSIRHRRRCRYSPTLPVSRHRYACNCHAPQSTPVARSHRPGHSRRWIHRLADDVQRNRQIFLKERRTKCYER